MELPVVPEPSSRDCIILCVCTQLCLTLCDRMDIAHQAPLSMGFSNQEYWSGLPFPPPGDSPDPASPALASVLFTVEPLSFTMCGFHFFFQKYVPIINYNLFLNKYACHL